MAPLIGITGAYDPVTRSILEAGGLFSFASAYAKGELQVERPSTPSRPTSARATSTAARS